VRPYVVGAILRNIKFTPETYKAFIDFQDKLHATFCRNRTVVSIGTHNLDSIDGPFKYAARDPASFKFVPLNNTEAVDGHGLMKLLENHKLKEYLPIIRDSPVYPLILGMINLTQTPRIASVRYLLSSTLSIRRCLRRLETC
jgi:phenylalanyl-tRNA synthetase beta chain